MAAVVAAALICSAVGTTPVAFAAPPPAAVLASSALPPADPSADLVVGGALLQPCDLGAGRLTWCGSLAVPLDRSDRGSAEIRVGFAWLPATGRSVGAVLTQEGGPGYPATGTAAGFVSMLGPVLDDHDLLLVDARGTGRSAVIDCRPLQDLAPPAARPALLAAAGRCGDRLDHTWRRSDGTWQHGSQLFTTAATVEDTAAVVRRLGTEPVDLYGDSYGSYFAQSFMSRHPELLRTVTLDSTYETVGLDPWYRTSAVVAHRALDLACQRSAACAAVQTPASGTSWDRIGRLVQRLRAHPVSGLAPATDGTRRPVTVDVRALVNMVNDAGYDAEVYRQLDPAVRAALAGDPLPLMRLYAQDIGYDYGDYDGPARSYSDAAYLAVACTDYPQLFDMRAATATRRAQLASAVAGADPSWFAPFTASEWTSMLDYTETYAGCLTWPAPVGALDPPVRAGAPLDPGHVPVLVLTGEFDSLTPDLGARHVARQIGSTATVLEAANNPHLVALEDAQTTCGAAAVRTFIASHRVVGPRCLASVAPLVLRAGFPTTLGQASPGVVAAGSPSAAARRAASVAWGAVLDAAYRYAVVAGRTDAGLRGGQVVVGDGGRVVRLEHLRWVGDATVTGMVDLTTGGTVTVRADDGQAWAIRLPGLTVDGIGLVQVDRATVRTAG